MAGGLRQGAFLSPAGYPPIHQARVAFQTSFRSHTQPLGHPRPKSFDQYVGRRHQLEGHLPSFGLFEVDCDRAFSAVENGLSRRIVDTPARAIHQCHLGAQVGQDHAGEGPGSQSRQLHHRDSRQRPVPVRCAGMG